MEPDQVPSGVELNVYVATVDAGAAVELVAKLESPSNVGLAGPSLIPRVCNRRAEGCASDNADQVAARGDLFEFRAIDGKSADGAVEADGFTWRERDEQVRG